MKRVLRSGRGITVLIAGLALGVLDASQAAAQNPFVIDGFVPENGHPDGVPPTEFRDPFGSVQELGAINGSTTKVGNINTDAPPTLDFTNPNGQVDLRRIWTQTAKAGGHLWFYFAWERDANTGSGFIAFEFQQNQVSPSCVYTGPTIDMVKPPSAAETSLIGACNPWAGRRAGDFLILWDQSGSALTISKRVYNGLAFGPSQPLGTAVARISEDGFRGEAAIDLTVDVFPPGGSCVSFANIIPGTVTGNSDTADYKDTVLSPFEPISNCGSVIVRKATVPAGEIGTFPYTLARSDASPIDYSGRVKAEGTLAFHGDFDTIVDLIDGENYTLSEGAVTGPWDLTSIVCAINGGRSAAGGTFAVEAGKTTTCIITNTRKRGKLTVIKHVVNDSGGTATAGQFQLSLGNHPQTPTLFAGSEWPGQTFEFDEGDGFDVSELSGPSGYAMVSRVGDCSGTIAAGVEKVCTITNDDQPAHLKLVKLVTNDNGGVAKVTDFTLQAVGPTPISGAGGVESDVNAGLYQLSETGVAGYTAGSWVCVGGSQSGSSITLGLGQSATCTIVNDDTKARPAGVTLQRATLHDTLSVTGIRPGGSELKATFRLYADGACSQAVGTPETVTVGVNGTVGTATTVAGVTVTVSGEYRWVVEFSGDQFNEGFTTACGSEVSTVTFRE